jgi:hypothetical protein
MPEVAAEMEMQGFCAGIDDFISAVIPEASQFGIELLEPPRMDDP